MAIIRPAPICLAESTPRRPTAPSPTTTTVPPGFTLAASAANQPVPNTSEAASRLGIRSLVGTPPGVGTSVPSACGTRRNGACARSMNSRCMQEDWYPYWQCGQVLSDVAKEPTTNCPGLMDLTALPTSSTMPQYSCPIGVGPSIGCKPRYD